MWQSIRQPAVAGMFYPAERDELEQRLRAYVGEPDCGRPAPKAIIAPHAGYIYSGPIAGTAYTRLIPARSIIRRVVLLGPSHRVYVRRVAAPEAEAFATPLGLVPVDHDAIAPLHDVPQLVRAEDAHTPEHSLEVHLPFLQHVLDDFSIVPLVVGDARAVEVAEIIERLWDGPETLIVVSSDLSHYHNYEAARRMDEATSKAIESLKPEAIGPEQACGRIPIQGLLLVAKKKGLTVEILDLRNSGDTAGPRDQVVGYGAYAVG